MSLTTGILFFLLGLNLVCLASLAARFPISNAVGDVFLRVRCPQTTSDCHLSETCYSTFKVCVKYNDLPQRCASVPELVGGYQCQSGTQRVLAVLPISVNTSVTHLSVVVMAKKKTIISTPEIITNQVKLIPGLKTLTNATVPRDESWQQLAFPLLFDFEAAFQCRQHHFGSLCQTFCNTPVCPPPPPATSAPKQCDIRLFCLNGGTCVLDTSGKMQCICAAFSRGQRCETLTRCNSNFCLNGGVCKVSGGSSPTCVCLHGWQGMQCEERVPISPVKSPCLPNPCENGGTCSGVNQAVCTCPTEWRGNMCESMSPCFAKPCKNNGNCSVVGNSFICSCPANALGVACQVLIPQSFLENEMFVILVSIGIALIIIIALIFGTCFLLRRRRSKRSEEFPVHIEATLRANERQRHSEIYEEIDSENCYSDGSADISVNLEPRDRVQRARTRSTAGLCSSRVVSVISRCDKTL